MSDYARDGMDLINEYQRQKEREPIKFWRKYKPKPGLCLVCEEEMDCGIGLSKYGHYKAKGHWFVTVE